MRTLDRTPYDRVAGWRRPTRRHAHRPIPRPSWLTFLAAWTTPTWPGRWGDPAVRTLIGHALAATVIGVMAWVSGPDILESPGTIAGLAIVAGLAFLHWVT